MRPLFRLCRRLPLLLGSILLAYTLILSLHKSYEVHQHSMRRLKYFGRPMTLEPIEEEPRGFYVKRPTKVNPFTFVPVIDAERCQNKTDMLIVVHSEASRRDRRDAIRKTWGILAYGGIWRGALVERTIHLVFALGLSPDTDHKSLLEENGKYSDLVQYNFQESHRSVTHKTIAMLRWSKRNCQNVRYFLKTDDDIFVNLPYLLRVLDRRNMTRGIMGAYNQRSRVPREGKRRLTPSECPMTFFPPYESGAAYVIHAELIKELYESAEYIPPIHLEDVYITGILGRILKVNHVIQDGFAFTSVKSVPVCDFVRNKMITSAAMTPKLLFDYWRILGTDACEDQ